MEPPAEHDGFTSCLCAELDKNEKNINGENGNAELTGTGLVSMHANVTLNAIKDLIRTRGRKPKQIITGNDTNFKGAVTQFLRDELID